MIFLAVTNNDLPLQETGIAKTRNCRSIDSNASWSSFEVEDEVSHYSLVDESRAKSRRERFGSSESGKGSTGSRDSFQGQPSKWEPLLHTTSGKAPFKMLHV